jgi:hypothetical protein
MQDAVRRLETEMTAVLVEQWRGCSWKVVELGVVDQRQPMLTTALIDGVSVYRSFEGQQSAKPQSEHSMVRRIERTLKLLVTESELFEGPKRVCMMTVGSMDELCAKLQTRLGITVPFVLCMFDGDFEEWCQVVSLQDFEVDTAKVKLEAPPTGCVLHPAEGVPPNSFVKPLVRLDVEPEPEG